MDEFEQVPFGGTEFAENPENRCPCLLLLDNSGSMNGRRLEELNAGLQQLKEELCADSMASKRVEVGVVSFGPVTVVNDFVTADSFIAPHLMAAGDTPMGAAIEQGLEMVRLRKEQYKQNGISYYRPWVFLITDGEPTDEWARAAAKIREGEVSKSFMFFAIGVAGANMETLGKISVRTPLSLKGLQFREMFSWLSNSLSSVSKSIPNTEVQLLNPATPDGWASV